MKKSANRDLTLEPKLGELKVDTSELEINLRKPVRPRKLKIKDENPVQLQDIEIKKPAIVIASLLLLISSTMFAFDQLFSPDSFQVEELKISADFKQLRPEQIREQVLPLIKNNYFAVDLKEVEQRVKNISWVDQVSVRRQWPRSIHIRLSEQQAAAHWGDNAYLNSRAEPFSVEQQANLHGLPYLYGPKGTEKELLDRFHQWEKRFAKKQLMLESLTMTPRYSYQAKVLIPREQQKQLTEQALMTMFEEKQQPVPVLDWRKIEPFALTLNLGKDDVEQRANRFIAAFPDAFDQHLLKVETIDLRYPNGFAVRWSEKDLPQDFLQLAATIDKKVSE